MAKSEQATFQELVENLKRIEKSFIKLKVEIKRQFQILKQQKFSK